MIGRPAINCNCVMTLRYCTVSSTLSVAVQLRLQGNAEARGGDLKAAEGVYSQALDLDIPQGKHLLHANRAGVRLTLGNAAGALEDAQAAVKLAPPGFTTAYIRQVRSLLCPALPCPAFPCPTVHCSLDLALPCSPGHERSICACPASVYYVTWLALLNTLTP